MWLPRQYNLLIVTSQWVFTVTSLHHCDAPHFMNGAVTSGLGKQHFVMLQIWAKLQVGDIQQWKNLFLEYYLCKLTFSILLINASNIRYEARIHQLNENVDSISGFEMLSSLCSDFKVTFLIYLGWIVISAISVYLKFNILQNGSTNIYERSHFRPNFATYKCMSMPSHTLNTIKISMLKYFTIKYALSSQ